MIKPEIICIGAGGHAHSCIDVIEQQGQYKIAGLIGLPDEANARLLKYSVIGKDDDLNKFVNIYKNALITVGQIKNADQRAILYELALKTGFIMPVIVSPFAHISSYANIGNGSIVMHGSIVNADVNIGNNCIINSRALIEHNSLIGDHCHISTGAIVNGNVNVGSRTFIGSGSILKEGISVGKNCVIGMGVILRHNLPDYSLFTGL